MCDNEALSLCRSNLENHCLPTAEPLQALQAIALLLIVSGVIWETRANGIPPR